MRRRSRSSDPAVDGGSASVEFVFAGLVLLVPILYLVIALGAVQEQALGVEAGARHTARAIATAPDAAAAKERAGRVLAAVAAEYGVDEHSLAVSVTCTPAGVACPEAGAIVRVSVSTTVQLPLVPPVLGLDRLTAVPVHATGLQKVSRFARSGE
jgi:Flp pilus assembly protein TadG